MKDNRLSMAMRDEKNARWKGDKVGVKALHEYVISRFPKPEVCQDCKLVAPQDLANISHTYNPETYNRELKNWEWLCHRCHMYKDGRIAKLIEVSRSRPVILDTDLVKCKKCLLVQPALNFRRFRPTYIRHVCNDCMRIRWRLAWHRTQKRKKAAVIAAGGKRDA